MQEVEKRTEEINTKHEVWDCGSSLYDSFELKSFQHQLNSAISSARTMSMPHLTHRRQPPPTTAKKHSTKISRSLHKLLRSLFRSPKQNHDITSSDATFFGYDTSSSLSTIPELPETLPETLPEFDHGFSPEMKSLVTRSRSDRFMPSSVGISCV